MRFKVTVQQKLSGLGEVRREFWLEARDATDADKRCRELALILAGRKDIVIEACEHERSKLVACASGVGNWCVDCGAIRQPGDGPWILPGGDGT